MLSVIPSSSSEGFVAIVWGLLLQLQAILLQHKFELCTEAFIWGWNRNEGKAHSRIDFHSFFPVDWLSDKMVRARNFGGSQNTEAGRSNSKIVKLLGISFINVKYSKILLIICYLLRTDNHPLQLTILRFRYSKYWFQFDSLDSILPLHSMWWSLNKIIQCIQNYTNRHASHSSVFGWRRCRC